MEEKIYLIYHDSMDDEADIKGVIIGTENEAKLWCEEYNKECEYSWQKVWHEELEILNK